MNDLRYGLALLTLAASLSIVGCGDDGHMPTSPGAVGPGNMPVGPSSFMSVSPRGGAMGVTVGAPLELHWGVPMGVGMEQYVDLHLGSLAGPVVPMNFAWSADRTTLVCTPLSPLQQRTQYFVHLGGGMVDANGQVVDMMQYGPGYGGQWIQGGMMGFGGHAGMDWGVMGGNWRHSNGSYGMAFSFTTE